MSWLDPFFLFFKNGVQLPARRRLNLGPGLTIVDDPANDRLNFDASSTPVLLPPRVVVADDDDLDFAGTPGFADVDIFAQTIVVAEITDTVTWDFFSDGVAEGWVVWFNITGTNGIVKIRDGGDTVILVMSTEEMAQVRGIYFDGAHWLPLLAGAGTSGEFILPTYIVTGGITNYTLDSRNVKDVVVLVDTSAAAVTVNLPVHRLGRTFFIKNWKATGGTHGITVHRNGGTGRINTVPADLGLGIRDYTVLCSDGIDNWEDLVITGT